MDPHGAYEEALERYAAEGVDAAAALEVLERVSLSVHCWQADDVAGFERNDSDLGGSGLAVTGNYPGRPRTMEELRQDLAKAFSLIPGQHRLSLHASYGDFSQGFPGRDRIGPEHFESWVEWAREQGLKLDFNATFFGHFMVKEGYTLASRDKGVREYWIEHGRRCREISSYLGSQLDDICIHNIWIPDGSKDLTPNRAFHRQYLKESLDSILAHPVTPGTMKDSVESKLFGIGTESFVAGSHEFYLGYALERGTLLTLDIGHFHPTESVADKVSALFLYLDELLFHITRGIRWDSDHVVAFNDPLLELMQELVWSGHLQDAHLGLDFFDATINRVGAYVIGARNTLKALLWALLLPTDRLRHYEEEGRYFERLALYEEFKSMPFGAVWDRFCVMHDTPPGTAYLGEIRKYEEEVLLQR